MTCLHRTLQKLALAALVVISAVVLTPTRALAQVDWSNTVVFQTHGSSFEDPLILLGFNPQPDPPTGDFPLVDVSPDGMMVSLSRNTNGTSNFRILFGITDGVFFEINAAGEPDVGQFQFDVMDGGSGALMFDVLFDISTDSGGVPEEFSWVGFNPQPDPPGLALGGDTIGFDFEFTSLSLATLEVRIQDSEGTMMTFTKVPEPSSVTLAALALLSMLAHGHRRRRA